MSNFTFGTQSRRKLARVHPHLVQLAEEALARSSVDFSIIEGSRKIERQRELVEAGASWTMMSRHIPSWVPELRNPALVGNQRMSTVKAGMYAHAIDVAPWVAGASRFDWPLFYKIHEAFLAAEEFFGFTPHTLFEWGGNWKKDKKDGPHFQLPFGTYPYLERPQ